MLLHDPLYHSELLWRPVAKLHANLFIGLIALTLTLF